MSSDASGRHPALDRDTPFSVSISSDCPSTLAFVQRYLRPSIEHANLFAIRTCLDISVRRNARPDHYELRVNGKLVSASEARPYLFTLAQQAVDDAVVQGLDRRAAVHAGTVVSNGKAILLPGASRSGKSSLVQELVRQGAEYCSDEFAIVDEAGLVYPYPRALMIRNDADEQHPVIASEMGGRVRLEPAPAALILFVQYQAGAPFELEPLDQGAALIRLLQNTPHVLTENPGMLAPLKAAASRAAAFEGTRGEMAAAAAKILEIAASAT